jgi:hypothetical protein
LEIATLLQTVFSPAAILLAVIASSAVILVMLCYLWVRRAAVSLAAAYIGGRELAYSELVLGTLLDSKSLSYGSRRLRGPFGRLVRRSTILSEGREVGLRPFDHHILEQMFLRQASELRGADRQHMTAIFEQLGAVARQIRLLRSRRAWKRVRAAQRLAIMRSSQSLPALVHTADDRNPAVRMAALRALGEINDPGTDGLMLDALEQSRSWAPLRVAEIVLTLGPQISIALLERLPRIGNPKTQALYVRLLGLLKEPAAVDTLAPLLQSEDVALRLETVRALGAIGDSRVARDIRALLGDPSAEVRAESARVLGALGEAGAASNLQALLADTSHSVRYSAARSLSLIGERGEQILRNVAAGGAPLARGIAEQVLAEHALGLV